MVTRTAERLLVSEGELADAIRLYEGVLRESDIVADIEVTLDSDPEDPEVPETNCIAARVRKRVEPDTLLDALVVASTRLRDAGLITPTRPISLDIYPDW